MRKSSISSTDIISLNVASTNRLFLDRSVWLQLALATLHAAHSLRGQFLPDTGVAVGGMGVAVGRGYGSSRRNGRGSWGIGHQATRHQPYGRGTEAAWPLTAVYNVSCHSCPHALEVPLMDEVICFDTLAAFRTGPRLKASAYPRGSACRSPGPPRSRAISARSHP